MNWWAWRPQEDDKDENEDNLAELLPPDRVANAVQRRGVQGDAHHIGNHLLVQVIEVLNFAMSNVHYHDHYHHCSTRQHISSLWSSVYQKNRSRDPWLGRQTHLKNITSQDYRQLINEISLACPLPKPINIYRNSSFKAHPCFKQRSTLQKNAVW